MKNKDLIEIPYKKSINIDLFDFIKNRVNIGLCVSKNLF